MRNCFKYSYLDIVSLCGGGFYGFLVCINIGIELMVLFSTFLNLNIL